MEIILDYVKDISIDDIDDNIGKRKEITIDSSDGIIKIVCWMED